MSAIETERLLLRPVAEDDLEALHAIQALPGATRWLYWEPRTLEEVRANLARRRADPAVVHRAIVVHATGELVGDIGLVLGEAVHRGAELGYILHRDHQGRGYATEAGRAMLALAFGELDLHRVCARLEPRNAASARVLQRLGMRREALLVENEWVKGEWQSEAIYAILASEWRE
jgi:RimJ/RimL family protein N-acetyltransferase